MRLITAGIRFGALPFVGFLCGSFSSATILFTLPNCAFAFFFLAESDTLPIIGHGQVFRIEFSSEYAKFVCAEEGNLSRNKPPRSGGTCIDKSKCQLTGEFREEIEILINIADVCFARFLYICGTISAMLRDSFECRSAVFMAIV